MLIALPRRDSGKMSAMMVGATGPYPPSPIPTSIRITSITPKTVAKPEPPVANDHNITPTATTPQRRHESAIAPSKGAAIMYETRKAVASKPILPWA